MEFDYRRRAALFAPDAGSGILGFHRFATLAEAVGFVVEELSPVHQVRAFIDVDDSTLGCAQIFELYGRQSYPRRRTRDRHVA